MKKQNAVQKLLVKYKHGWILSYFFVYMIWFSWLEKHVTTKFNLIHSRLDDFIPFNELFIIPYILWFFYIFITVAYFFITSKQDFYKCCAFLFTGMTICLIIYTLWPNGHNLRVDFNTLGRSNLFTDIIARLYKFDTSTNVFPSIHVFNSIGAMIAIHKSERLCNKKWLQRVTLLLTILICMSTVFLKQHSIMDVFGGVLLAIPMYLIVYVPAWGKEAKLVKKRRQELSKVS